MMRFGRAGTALVALTASVGVASCGSGDGDGDGAAASEASTEFCEEVRSVQAAWADDQVEASDYLRLAELLMAIEPPDAIADAWRTSFDTAGSPEAAAEASQRVVDYLEDECRIDLQDGSGFSGGPVTDQG